MGQSNIEEEITSPENQRFILHDSQGFEPGDLSKYDVVRAFINKRMAMPKLEDRLHAIWYRMSRYYASWLTSPLCRLCLPVPFVGGRVFEVGDEEILKTIVPGRECLGRNRTKI